MHDVVCVCPPFLNAIALGASKGVNANAAVAAIMTAAAITSVFVCNVK